jgi:putative ABC transport system ATP-binding protein
LNIPELQILEGHNYLFLGNSGSGKTTLLHILAGLIKPQEGEVILADTNITQLRTHQMDHFRGNNLGLIFQKSHLISALTVLENLLLAQYLGGIKKDTKRIQDVLSDLNVQHKKSAKIYELSQGEAQRISIARAMLNKPKIILADEPTSSLDDENCERVIEMLQNQASQYNATMVITTHDHRIKKRFEKSLML